MTNPTSKLSGCQGRKVFGDSGGVRRPLEWPDRWAQGKGESVPSPERLAFCLFLGIGARWSAFCAIPRSVGREVKKLLLGNRPLMPNGRAGNGRPPCGAERSRAEGPPTQ